MLFCCGKPSCLPSSLHRKVKYYLIHEFLNWNWNQTSHYYAPVYTQQFISPHTSFIECFFTVPVQINVTITFKNSQ